MQHLDAGRRRLRAGCVARAIAIDRRDLDAADPRDHVLAVDALDLRLLHRAGEVAGEVAGLLLTEEQTLNVLRTRDLRVGRAHIDDRELRVRERSGGLADGLGHQEADADHEICTAGRGGLEVRDVVLIGLRLLDLDGDTELGSGLLQALVGERVEALVVETTDVGDQNGLDRRMLLGIGGRCGNGGDDERGEHRRDQGDTFDGQKVPPQLTPATSAGER